MTDSKLLIIDTETGGLSVKEHSLLSIGAAVWINQTIVDQIEIFVREPEPSIDPEAIAATGFDLSLIETQGQSPKEAVRQFEVFLARHFGIAGERKRIPVAGHNVQFDIDFIGRLYGIAEAQFKGLFSHRVLDTAGILAFLILAERLPSSCSSSTGAFEYFGITFEPGKRHTALADALATATLLRRLLELVD
jgi:DNA polymerase III epsilon subunit-like protein